MSSTPQDRFGLRSTPSGCSGACTGLAASRGVPFRLQIGLLLEWVDQGEPGDGGEVVDVAGGQFVAAGPAAPEASFDLLYGPHRCSGLPVRPCAPKP